MARPRLHPIATTGPSLIDWLGPIVPLAAHYPLESQRYFMAKDREVAVDWKVYGENYLECYHCPNMHPGLCEALDISRYTIDPHPEHGLFHLYGPKRDGSITDGLYFYRFPYLMLNFYQWGSSIATLEPLGRRARATHQLVSLLRYQPGARRGEQALGRMVGADRDGGSGDDGRCAAQPQHRNLRSRLAVAAAGAGGASLPGHGACRLAGDRVMLDSMTAAAKSYDAVIIGSGHNGLVCANYLARRGMKVAVLERRHVIGGAAVTEEIAPGFRASIFSYLMSLLHPRIIRDFDLPKHG